MRFTFPDSVTVYAEVASFLYQRNVLETPQHQMAQQILPLQLLSGDEVKIGTLELFFGDDLLEQSSRSRDEDGRLFLEQFVKPLEAGRYIVRMGR